jgi:predicted TIM-barrel fold metal-dependent hydrolase
VREGGGEVQKLARLPGVPTAPLKTSVAEMQRILEPKSPFVGFKLHGGIDQYPADGVNYQPLFEFANEHRLRVLYHAWVVWIGSAW